MKSKTMPTAVTAREELCRKKEFNLGDVFAYNYGDGYVFNLATQLTWRTKADINAIEHSRHKMFSFAATANLKSISLPKIGAGLGGLKWEPVKMIIDDVSKSHPGINLTVIENYDGIQNYQVIFKLTVIPYFLEFLFGNKILCF